MPSGSPSSDWCDEARLSVLKPEHKREEMPAIGEVSDPGLIPYPRQSCRSSAERRKTHPGRMPHRSATVLAEIVKIVSSLSTRLASLLCLPARGIAGDAIAVPDLRPTRSRLAMRIGAVMLLTGSFVPT